MKTKRDVVRVGTSVMASVVVAMAAGCGRHDHDHGGAAASEGGHKHASVHGGVAVELGDHEFHLDFVAEPGTGTLKAWVMDAHADQFVRVTNAAWGIRVATPSGEKDLELVAQGNPATGESAGDTSQFEGRADWLKGLDRFSAVVPSIYIRGKRFENLRFAYPAR